MRTNSIMIWASQLGKKTCGVIFWGNCLALGNGECKIQWRLALWSFSSLCWTASRKRALSTPSSSIKPASTISSAWIWVHFQVHSVPPFLTPHYVVDTGGSSRHCAKSEIPLGRPSNCQTDKTRSCCYPLGICWWMDNLKYRGFGWSWWPTIC